MQSPFYNAPLESTAAVGDTPTYPKASEELGQGDHVTDFDICSSQYDTDMQDHTEWGIH